MFITKKRHAVETALLNREIIALEQELAFAEAELSELIAENEDMKRALTFIAAQRTSSANATVTRMADKADEVLGNNEKATFIEDEEAPTGTLADIRRALNGTMADHTAKVKGNVSYTLMPVGNPTDVRTTFDWTGLDTSADASSGD